MARIHRDAEAQLRDLGPDAEDEALLRHVLGDDEPPQGLHRGGFKARPCDQCHGEGRVEFMPPGPRDPQRVETGICDVCHGSGTADGREGA